MDDSDPYGSLGAISIASWEARWMSWANFDQDAYLASVAHWGPLDITQMVHLIQGLLPPTYEWLSMPTCLAEFSPLVDRLKQDIQRGIIASAPTPDEFAAWCDLRNVSLPAPFVNEIHAMAASPPVVHVPQQSTTKIIGPAWLPVPASKAANSHSRSPPKRGRPCTTAPTLDPILQEAKSRLIAAAERGEIKTIPDLVREIMGAHKDLGMTSGNLTRRLKGKLPIKQARATATKHQAVAPPKLQRRNLY
ncbi:MAG: hypothetical protein K9K38_12130 [Rhodoferax sp.]|nr:hypothetical protein [Rhodoferax sp.]